MNKQAVIEKEKTTERTAKYHILVSDAMSQEGLLPLLENANVHCVEAYVDEVEDLTQFDALLVRSATKVTEELLQKMPNLKIVARAGVGVDNIDLDAATKHGVVVVNAPDGNTISTAEHTFAMISSLLRKIPQANASIKAGEWNRKAFQGSELRGKTLGIVGFGRIGTQIAKRARAFEMSLLVFDPFLTKARAEKIGVTPASLDDVLAQSDIITVHTPLTKETKGILGMENIAKTKQGVFLINCARGGIIDESALKHYLANGHIAGAALDVFEEEPAQDKELLEFDNVIATPHIAASTKEAQLNVASQVSEEVIRFLEGQPATNSINLPTLSKEIYEKIQPYYDLTKRMGNLLSQVMKTPVQEIEVYYGGNITDLETSITTRSLIAGFLQPRVDAAVNDVNAALIAKERGITYGEKHVENTFGYSNLIHAVVHGEDRHFDIKGTYIKEYGARIVSINGFNVDFIPQGHLLYIQHNDKPGVIGRIGQLLAEHDVNIATMQVGRKQEGGEAIMMITVDKTVEEDVLKAVRKIEDIQFADKIEG
ncbi:phosphoglycerate dehydrogenase [Alkalihalophilus marmarensis]|jgi:D-3-phosphoglycerate dehydrogenase|uniref:D-3-phosphoglycerate dehydrogenase n=1 Tax=Alkalihalophilus marmarensis DSM 21297 TaxID=1188261 RepID=U6SQY3_9BACI|nr:phosphoglycerate dehydrogenase [Alkalihalophilus marmarensis]ERN54129.1 3-phosphoglycerate dehydrogenase [Alkalihalophilus marmarensis DSM 21297]MCM3488448.1 phosphoglycerate dehydrogenase [Alkalihalophilus marmarensis]